MTILDSTQPEANENSWQCQLDRFVENYQLELAALAWGFYQQYPEQDKILGIDFIPTPHFIYSSREALEKLNKSVNNKLQEILGLIDSYQPEKEVLMIGFSNNGIKLIYFEPEVNPPDCFQNINQTFDTLLDELEGKMTTKIKV